MDLSHLVTIAQLFQELGVKSYYVGGYVRDKLLGKESNDIDVCLVGATPDLVVRTLKFLPFVSSITSSPVGNLFPVWVADVEGVGKVEFALARTEISVGKGHTDFLVNSDGISIEEDLFRRDLTINSMAEEILTGKLIDPYHGADDLFHRIARPVSAEFKKDDLRAMRAARFCSSLELTPTAELYRMCSEMNPLTISKERVGKELKRLFESDGKPSIFFNFLQEIGWLEVFFKELYALRGVPQNPKYHPEGDAYVHTLLCMDQVKPEWEDKVFIKTVMLCHDYGKALRTVVHASGKITSIEHEIAGVQPTHEFLERIVMFDKKFHERVAMLVELHMVHTLTKISNKVIKQTLRRLMSLELTYDQLYRVCYCDINGRGGSTVVIPEIGHIKADHFVSTGVMEPVVTSKMLLDAGLSPGQFFGKYLAKALELQDRGSLNQENWFDVMKGAGFFIPKKV